jgi:hypothetical protein
MDSAPESESISICDTFECAKCGPVPLSECKIFRSKNVKSGYRTYCCRCSKVRNSKSYFENKESHDAGTKIWRRSNPEASRLIGQTSNSKWRRNNPEKALGLERQNNARTRDLVRSIKSLAREKYGIKCQCCGEEEDAFLCIDHVDGGGTQHRKTIGIKFWFWLAQENFPPGFRTLCHNCNMSYGSFGGCPHQPDFVYIPDSPSSKSIRKIRSGVIAEYGGKCSCCDEKTYEFLALDHVGGGGRSHLKELGLKSGGINLARWARDNGYPDLLRVLCHNCNFASGQCGMCPHSTSGG